MFALSVLSLVITTGCSTKPPDIQPVPVTKLVYPASPPISDMTCPPEPKPGVITTDVEAARFTEAVRTAGADCRNKLGLIHNWIDSWKNN